MIERDQDSPASTTAKAPDGRSTPDRPEAAPAAPAEASGVRGDLTERIDELKTSAEAEVDNPTNQFEERRS